MTSVRVAFDHDGGVDDFVALAFLLSQTKSVRSATNAVGPRTVELLAVTLIDADCFGEPALAATLRYLDLTGNSHVPVALSSLKGTNDFPTDWRLDSFKIASQPQLHQAIHPRVAKAAVGLTGEQLLLKTLRESDGKVTVVCTGPLTNLAWCLAEDATIVSKIEVVIAMAGAIDVPGNVQQQFTPTQHDHSAEWNLFFDPRSAELCLGGRFADLKVCVVPLDCTNAVPITAEHIQAYGGQFAFSMSMLVGNVYALVAQHILRTNEHYYAWDAITVLYLLRPDLFVVEDTHVRVHVDDPSAGRTERVPDSTPNTKRIAFAKRLEAHDFYAEILRALRCNTL